MVFPLRRSASPDSLKRLCTWWEIWFSCRIWSCPSQEKSAKTWTGCRKMRTSRLQVAVMCDNTALLWIYQSWGHHRHPCPCPVPWEQTPCHDTGPVSVPPGCQSLLMVPQPTPSLISPGAQGGAKCQGWACRQCPLATLLLNGAGSPMWSPVPWPSSCNIPWHP